jgi:hypothetical protein
MTPSRQSQIEAAAALVKTKGPCLVPRPESVNENSTLLICHENYYCDCEMVNAFIAGAKFADDNPSERVLMLVEAVRKCRKVRMDVLDGVLLDGDLDNALIDLGIALESWSAK